MSDLEREIEFWSKQVDRAKTRDAALIAFGALAALRLYRGDQEERSAQWFKQFSESQ